MLNRRRFMAVSGAALAAPALAQGANARVLKFIPQADLTVLDPIWTTAYVTRNHGLAVFDTLYGLDAGFRAQPQMAAGHVTENDGKLWKITLRPGLKGMPFLAHPRVQPNGVIWNIGLGGKQAVVWKLAPDGTLLSAEMIALPRGSYMHDFTATARHLVLILQPWVQDSFRMPFSTSMVNV